VVAVAAYDLEDLSEAFVVAYVVADEEGFSHGITRVLSMLVRRGGR
jgi:hypothetical protein